MASPSTIWLVCNDHPASTLRSIPSALEPSPVFVNPNEPLQSQLDALATPPPQDIVLISQENSAGSLQTFVPRMIFCGTGRLDIGFGPLLYEAHRVPTESYELRRVQIQNTTTAIEILDGNIFSSSKALQAEEQRWIRAHLPVMGEDTRSGDLVRWCNEKRVSFSVVFVRGPQNLRETWLNQFFTSL